jgi:hypothetical protein
MYMFVSGMVVYVGVQRAASVIPVCARWSACWRCFRRPIDVDGYVVGTLHYATTTDGPLFVVFFELQPQPVCSDFVW